MITFVKGDLLDSDCDYICHQVNCMGVMGAGIAKQIRERYPEVYNVYRNHCGVYSRSGASILLGHIDIVPINSKPGFHVINMYSQKECGTGKRYTSYDAFNCALHYIRYMIPPYASIGFPKNIGCGLGGGNWNLIVGMIHEVLAKDRDVYIYEI